MSDLTEAVSRYGAAAKRQYAGPARGSPEDQLRRPIVGLLEELAPVLTDESDIVLTDETTVTELRTRPDYAVSIGGALVGFLELKAPGKGANPDVFRNDHDREQWQRLKALPNLLYTDGNAFGLYRNGERVGLVRLEGDVETSGSALVAPQALQGLLADFLNWTPLPPRGPEQLADTAARLCRLLRDELEEQMGRASRPFRNLEEDWRAYLFPDATDRQFADGYAQAVTYGLLLARARNVDLTDDLSAVSTALQGNHSVIAAALRLLTDDAQTRNHLSTSLATMIRVLGAVQWAEVTAGESDAWLYFYERFLGSYDSELRQKTGSYYTPPQVVTEMVRLVDEALMDADGFGLRQGLADEDVVIADPAVGTGTFPLAVLRRIASKAGSDDGLVPSLVSEALPRLVGFELQFGPFAVAQLRLLAEVAELTGEPASSAAEAGLRLYLTNTLDDPYAELERYPQVFRALGESRQHANEVKRDEPVTVVIGNPPYKDNATGLGGWVESGSPANPLAPMDTWKTPEGSGLGPHGRHRRNLYAYFWRWAMWKVFQGAPREPAARVTTAQGVVCYITVSGFLSNPGFRQMRAELRRDASEVWVIDCSPEGFRADVPNRVFEDVMQEVCIVIAVRAPGTSDDVPAVVRHRRLPRGPREEKFAALARVSLDDADWTLAATEAGAPLLPRPSGPWASFVPLGELFAYEGTGVMAGRRWPIAPDPESLRMRWDKLQGEPDIERRRAAFQPHLTRGEPGDRYLDNEEKEGLRGHEHRAMSVAADQDDIVQPVRYAFLSFDRQFVIPDKRLLNRPNPKLWNSYSEAQVFLTTQHDRHVTSGPGATATAHLPHAHHYAGRGGRVYPLYHPADPSLPNLRPGVLELLRRQYRSPVTGEDLFAYITGIMAHPVYTERFHAEPFSEGGQRVPLPADLEPFEGVRDVGRRVLWLHAFGERYCDPDAERPAGPPRATGENAPRYPREGRISEAAGALPRTMSYDEEARRLHVGDGYVDNVAPEVFAYEVSGQQVLTQWFSNRDAVRERPQYDRRASSPLEDCYPDRWLPVFTRDLLDILHVLTLLTAMESEQLAVIERVLTSRLLPFEAMQAEGAFVLPKGFGKDVAPRIPDGQQGDLLV